MTQTSDKLYSLSKSRSILKNSLKLFSSQSKKLTEEKARNMREHLQLLNQAITDKDQIQANRHARIVEEFTKENFKKTFSGYLLEIFIAIAVALLIATVVRSMWFELYEIPTGSMRPTFEEQDHLTVSKTTFGINVPLQTAHFYFDPALVKRAGIVIWSGDQIPHLDSESTFMGLPYAKRFIKRLMGKPGDTLYFYGGKIYGFDSDGNDLKELRDSPYLAKLDHVPFTHFEGRKNYIDDPTTKMTNQVVFHLMNQTLGRIRFQRSEMKGEIFNGKEWIQDNPQAQKTPHSKIETYSDFWGIRNFAIGRLLKPEQMQKFTAYPTKKPEKGILYLEVRHNPSLTTPAPYLSNQFGVTLPGFTTLIPLQEEHLKALMDTMYTCRFIVKDGKAQAYRLEQQNQGPYRATNPSFPHVPDGAYEFYYGKAYKIGWGAIASELPKDHPLYSLDLENVQSLYNFGIEMSTLVEPQSSEQALFPSRYVYFREGDIYTMGGILLKKDDPILKTFNENEFDRQEKSSENSPYVAFKDYGPPLNEEGDLNKEFLTIFGYKIPDGRYLMLGDNHAMSQDSRWFGPIPQANLQGTPSLIIWPPGPRLGPPLQKPYPVFVTPRLIVWALAAIILLICWFIQRRRMQKLMMMK